MPSTSGSVASTVGASLSNFPSMPSMRVSFASTFASINRFCMLPAAKRS